MTGQKIIVNVVDSRTLIFKEPREKFECFRLLRYWLRSEQIEGQAFNGPTGWRPGMELKVPSQDVLDRLEMRYGLVERKTSTNMGNWSMRHDGHVSPLADMKNAITIEADPE